MAEVLKVLAQSNPLATTLTDVYTVPAATSTVVSSLVLANRGATDRTFRLALAIAGAADALKQYLYYDVALFARDTLIASIAVTLAGAHVVRVLGHGATVTVNVLCAAEC